MCRCDCGTVKSVRRDHLRSGTTKSCGCLSREKLVARWTAHGEARRQRKTPEYKIWTGIRRRCLNFRNKLYPYYGGRGITLHESWRSFSQFLEDVGRRPSPKHQLDRIDNDKGYEPGNVRWTTSPVQARNRRSNIVIEYNGESMTLIEWTERLGLPYKTIYSRIKKLGWTPERAFTTPIRRKK